MVGGRTSLQREISARFQSALFFPLRCADLVAQTIKNLPAKQETQVQFLGQGRSSGEGNGYSLQYSCLENSMDRGAWRATVHEVAKNQIRQSD